MTGSISFARFMALALYCPVYGFYERERDTIGRCGDYYTSVSVGSLFGELLACQFSEWLSACGTGNGERGTNGNAVPLQIVEAGAHDGQLAKDLLRWLKEHRPELFHQLEYWIVEPSRHQQKQQQQSLAGFASNVRWASQWADVVVSPCSALRASRSAGVRGVVFCNELLDAMPVHRLGWDAKRRFWFEWRVGASGDDFIWMKMPGAIGTTAPAIQSRFQLPVCPFELPAELLDVLPDGFIVEISPAALNWWQHAGEALERGKLLAIDYGLSAGQFFAAERCGGTLRAYHRHHVCADLLANAGEQDITAHVNFTAIRAAGESAGLKTEAFLTQAQLLTGITARTWEDEGVFGKWTAERIRQFQTLTHPEHLGRAFRALVQSR